LIWTKEREIGVHEIPMCVFTTIATKLSLCNFSTPRKRKVSDKWRRVHDMKLSSKEVNQQ